MAYYKTLKRFGVSQPSRPHRPRKPAFSTGASNNTTSRSSGSRSKSSRPSYGRRPAKRGPRKENIHPSKFVKAAKPVAIEEYVPTHTFADFKISRGLLENISRKGITVPSPIQDQAIPLGLEGKDVIGIANTGTGKTIAFSIPVIQKLVNNRTKKVLIVAPTRELAEQIEAEMRSIATGSGLSSVLLIGGTNIQRQLRTLKTNPPIIIGTPGRIKDHLDRKSLRLLHVDTVVLDEVDRMLDMGFIDDMKFLLSHLAQERQSFFFSATMDSRVESLIRQFSNDPVTVSVKTGITSDNVEQNVVGYRDKNEKIDKLHDLLISAEVAKALVFDDTQRSVEKLSKELITRGFKADAIHGGKTQGQRQRALKKFKDNQIDILVATDVAARGIDVADISHVINYSTPQTYEDYVHRVGRAGRAGKTGTALTFIEY